MNVYILACGIIVMSVFVGGLLVGANLPPKTEPEE